MLIKSHQSNNWLYGLSGNPDSFVLFDLSLLVCYFEVMLIAHWTSGCWVKVNLINAFDK